MTKLKLGPLEDDRPVKLTVELPAQVHRDLVAYAKILARETGQTLTEPAKLIGPMLARFMATDRAFTKLRRTQLETMKPSGSARNLSGEEANLPRDASS